MAEGWVALAGAASHEAGLSLQETNSTRSLGGCSQGPRSLPQEAQCPGQPCSPQLYSLPWIGSVPRGQLCAPTLTHFTELQHPYRQGRLERVPTLLPDRERRCPREAAQLAPHALPLDGVAGPPHGELERQAGGHRLARAAHAGLMQEAVTSDKAQPTPRAQEQGLPD